MRNRLLGHPRGPRPPLTEMVAQIPPAGPSPAGAFRAATDIARTEAYSAVTSDHRHDPRVLTHRVVRGLTLKDRVRTAAGQGGGDRPVREGLVLDPRCLTHGGVEVGVCRGHDHGHPGARRETRDVDAALIDVPVGRVRDHRLRDAGDDRRLA